MNRNQKLSPKYWVVHDPKTDDIIPETMSKSRDGAIIKYATTFHGESLAEITERGTNHHPEDEGYRLLLVEIGICKVQREVIYNVDAKMDDVAFEGKCKIVDTHLNYESEIRESPTWKDINDIAQDMIHKTDDFHVYFEGAYETEPVDGVRIINLMMGS